MRVRAHRSEVITHRTTTVATITHPLANTGLKDSAMTGIIPVGRQANARRLMVTFIAEDVTYLTITVLMFFILTKNVTSTHQHLMTAIHVDYLMAS